MIKDCLFKRQKTPFFNLVILGLDKKLSQLMDCPLPTNNTHIIMSTKITHTQI